MPAKSEKQRRLMAIAEHNPEKLYKKNRDVLKMSKKQLHEFASKKHHSAANGSFLEERKRKFKV